MESARKVHVKGSVEAAAPRNEAAKAKDREKEEIQGVFVIRNRKAEFMPVETGITGTTDIEVLKGLKDGDEIELNHDFAPKEREILLAGGLLSYLKEQREAKT